MTSHQYCNWWNLIQHHSRIQLIELGSFFPYGENRDNNPMQHSPNESLAFQKIIQIDKFEFQLVQRWIPKMCRLAGFFPWAPLLPDQEIFWNRSKKHHGVDNARLVKKNRRVGQPVTIGITFFWICWKFVRTIMTAQIRDCESKVSPCPSFEKLAKFFSLLYGSIYVWLTRHDCVYSTMEALPYPKKSIQNLEWSFGWKIGKA